MFNFSKTFTTREGTFTLTFSKIASLSMNKYFVVSEKDAVQVAAFDIKQNKQGEWKVIEPAPDCIIQAETILAAIVEANSKEPSA